MRCPECQFENREEAKFCSECGYKFEIICPKCRHKILPGTKFCEDCGSTLSHTSEKVTALSFDEKLAKIQKYLPKGISEKILSQRDKIEGERKQITVMFCDIVDFTQISEILGPEETYSVMDQVYEILIHIVQEHEGTVNEFTGDGIMALFGAPIALEDSPQRAILSAYAIHKQVTNFSDKIKHDKKNMPPLKMRIGIHTGPVVVGALGNDLRVEFKAVGNTVNLAARMEGLAEPGTIYVTEDTFKLTGGIFRFGAMGKRKVKGKKEAVSVYKLLSVKEDVYSPSLRFERVIYSEMVGRDKELNKLQFQVMKAVNGEGSVVNIIGEAGIGKSRLVAELRKREVVAQVTLIEGRAISMGRNLSFHPIINLLKQWARIKDNDTKAAAFERLEIAVRSLYHDDFVEVLPFVATMMGMKLLGRYAERVKGIEGEALEKLILKAVRDLLVKATEVTPLVIVMEDLHWADTSSVDLILSIFRLAEMQPIVFINVFRPEYKETGDRILTMLREDLQENYVEIVLEPLDDRMSDTLINNMMNLREFQHPIIEKIVERSDGNPFFIEEIVRSFIDEGALVLKDGIIEVTEKIDSMVIPYTINDVLMARIDRLEEKTRNLVKIASVIGRNFFSRILADVAVMIEEIDKKLSYLKEIELIRERKRMGELEYLFKHALAQEAAYESILFQNRRELHLKVAKSIENVFKERLHEFYGMLAYHYSLSEHEEKTEEYLIKAGEEALKSSASSEALHYYQEALQLYLNKYGEAADPAKVATLENNIAVSLFNKGRYAEAIEYFDKSLAISSLKLPKNSVSAILKSIVSLIYLLISFHLPLPKFRKITTDKDIEVMRSMFKRMQTLGFIDAKRFFLESLYAINWILNFDLCKVKGGFGFVGASSILFSVSGFMCGLGRKLIEASRKRTDTNDFISVLQNELGALMYHVLLGDWKTANEYDGDLVAQNLSMGEVYMTCLYVYWHGFLLLEKGYYRDAQKMVGKLSDIFNIYENDFAQSNKYGLNMRLLVKIRNLQEFFQESKPGMNFRKKLGSKWLMVEDYSYKARSQILLNDLSGAEGTLNFVRTHLSGNKHVFPCWKGALLLSNFTLNISKLEKSKNTGSPSKISKNGKTAIRSGRKLEKKCRKFALERTEAYRLMGTYHWLVGKQNKALKWWNESIKVGERLGARLELSRSYMEVGKRLFERKSKFSELNRIKPEEYLEKARTMFQEMDLQWDLDELAKLH